MCFDLNISDGSSSLYLTLAAFFCSFLFFLFFFKLGMIFYLFFPNSAIYFPLLSSLVSVAHNSKLSELTDCLLLLARYNRSTFSLSYLVSGDNPWLTCHGWSHRDVLCLTSLSVIAVNYCVCTAPWAGLLAGILCCNRGHYY